MFPKRDHLSIGLGLGPQVDGAALRAELDVFLERVRARLFPGVALHVCAKKATCSTAAGRGPRSRAIA